MKWWSDSKGEWMEISDMHGRQVANAIKKLRRGDYAPPGEPLSVDEELRLDQELTAELERRGLDDEGRESAPTPADDDAPPGVDL